MACRIGAVGETLAGRVPALARTTIAAMTIAAMLIRVVIIITDTRNRNQKRAGMLITITMGKRAQKVTQASRSGKS